MKNLLKKYISYTAILPLIVFVLVARYKGLLAETVKSDVWQYPFYYAAIAALIVIGLHFIFQVPLKRMILSVNIFLIGSAGAFLLNNEFLLSLLSDYSGAAFFLAMIITGIITIFTPDKFVSDVSLSEVQNSRLSLIILLGCFFAFIWALIFNNCGIIVSIAVPFVVLRLVSALLILKMKKSK